MLLELNRKRKLSFLLRLQFTEICVNTKKAHLRRPLKLGLAHPWNFPGLLTLSFHSQTYFPGRASPVFGHRGPLTIWLPQHSGHLFPGWLPS